MGVRRINLGRPPRGLRALPRGSQAGDPREGNRCRERPLAAAVLFFFPYTWQGPYKGNRLRVGAPLFPGAPPPTFFSRTPSGLGGRRPLARTILRVGEASSGRA